jgi:hypothetical protein
MRWSSSSQASWSSMLRVSGVGVSTPVRRSSTVNRHLRAVLAPDAFLNAIFVRSGDSDGHSTLSCTTVTWRADTLPRTR